MSKRRKNVIVKQETKTSLSCSYQRQVEDLRTYANQTKIWIFQYFFYLNVALTETKRNRVWMQIVPLNLSLRIYNSFGSQIRPKFEPTIKLRLGSFPVKCNVTKFKPTITQTGSPTSVELLPQNPIQSPLQLLGLSMHRPTKVNKEVMFLWKLYCDVRLGVRPNILLNSGFP